MKDADRITNLEDRYIKCAWYVTVHAGTTGTITPPTGGTLVMNQWPSNVSAKTSTITAGQMPTMTAALTGGGATVTVTMNATGAWALSAAPSAYPIAIIYMYKVKLYQHDPDYLLLRVPV
jgi:hypothetical protein